MNTTSTTHDALPVRILSPRHIYPALIILIVQVALFAWMAPRGFEFTDESYYLHNFLYWREFTGTVTFFGAYFEWPFRASGASITAMRILSLVLVLASAAVLMRGVVKFSLADRERAPGGTAMVWYLVTPMASAMLFFGYLATLRAPSYNLLSLATMALMTACVLSVMERRRAAQGTAGLAILYGLALGACFLSKATTAALVALTHLVFFLALNRDWDWKWLLQVVAQVSAGFMANFVLLTIAFPDWFSMLREGLEITRVRDGSYSMWLVLNSIRWALQTQLPVVGPWLLGVALLFYVGRRHIASASRATLSLLVIVLVAAIPFSHLYMFRSRVWLIVTVAVVAGLWAIERLARQGRPAGYDERRELALVLLLMTLPLAFSFGTNMPVLGHSAIASLFAFCAVCLRLYRLAGAGAISGVALALSLALLCVPALATQWLAATDIRYTYRQAAALAAQDTPLTLGTRGSVVHVDRATGRALLDLQEMARQAGMPPGQEVLDLSGDGVGALYAIGARPLGSPWIIGGYPGSSAAAERVVQKLDAGRVRAAWLLTSTDNRRRLKDWRDILARRIGHGTHQLAGSVDVINPHAASGTDAATVNVQLWKPVGPDAAAAPVLSGKP